MNGRLCLALLTVSSMAASAAPASAQEAPTAASARSEIEAIRQQLRALQARLDKLEAQEAPAETAPGTISSAPTIASASPAPLPAAASAPATSGLSTPAPALPDWVTNTKIGGKAYINVSAISQRSDGAKASQDGVQTDVKRFYLTVDHKFSDVFSANLTTDFRYGTNGTSNDGLVYVKKAYLQAKFAPEFYVRVGAADLPWVPFVEDIYGYRFVENMLDERVKYATSSDFGVHIGGTFGNGLISYAVSAIDGLGYKTRTRQSDTLDLEGRISAQPIKGITLAVGGYTGKLGKSVGGQPDTFHRATRLDALAAYTSKKIRVGVEYFEARNWNNVTIAATDRTLGWSVFGSYALTPKLTAFGRYDWVDPNRYTNAPLKEHYANLGLNYEAVHNVDIALVYKRDKATNGLVATSNGTIGGVGNGTYDEIGIWSQVKF